MKSLFQIVYASTAAESFGKPELMELLQSSVQRNQQAGITGLLLYKDGLFMQALEGEKPAVQTLFQKISHDPRHRNIIPLIQEPIEHRYFPNSAMAFRDLKSPELQDLPGFSDFLNTPLDGTSLKKDLTKCQRLLLHFKKHIR